MSKTPKSVNVLGRQVKVILSSPCLMPNGESCLGFYCPVTHEIHIEKQQTEHEIWLTFLHELWHAFEVRNGFRRTSVHGDVCEMLAESFSQFVDENFRYSPRKK